MLSEDDWNNMTIDVLQIMTVIVVNDVRAMWLYWKNVTVLINSRQESTISDYKAQKNSSRKYLMSMGLNDNFRSAFHATTPSNNDID